MGGLRRGGLGGDWMGVLEVRLNLMFLCWSPGRFYVRSSRAFAIKESPEDRAMKEAGSRAAHTTRLCITLGMAFAVVLRKALNSGISLIGKSRVTHSPPSTSRSVSPPPTSPYLPLPPPLLCGPRDSPVTQPARFKECAKIFLVPNNSVPAHRYGGTACKFCRFHKRGPPPSPPVQPTKLTRCTSVESVSKSVLVLGFPTVG